MFSVRLDEDDDIISWDDYHDCYHEYDDYYHDDAEGGRRTFAFSQTGPFPT